MSEYLSSGPYRGVRDFYPEDAAIQQYIFDTWRTTAESFGFARYDASVLEPAELYKAKGAENEEMVNDQTYTFTDRGDREVTLRPEMTPTVARMVAGAAARRELTFPVRWYSIPNLFRYERMQRGRLREHWQLNCDIFGGDSVAADVEMVALASQILTDFGASPDMFEIRVNNRAVMDEWYDAQGIADAAAQTAITKLNDRRRKLSDSEYRSALREILGTDHDVDHFIAKLDDTSPLQFAADSPLCLLTEHLADLGLTNVLIDKTIARGFNYYTGTVFEIFDTAPENNRSLLGGGRYDNLTALFGGEPISGVGFGMGDVTMRDFLETHNLLPQSVTRVVPDLLVIPNDPTLHHDGQCIAARFRTAGLRTAVDYSARKLGKKLASASDRGVTRVLVFGADELASGTFTVKNLADGAERSGTLETLLAELSA